MDSRIRFLHPFGFQTSCQKLCRSRLQHSEVNLFFWLAIVPEQLSQVSNFGSSSKKENTIFPLRYSNTNDRDYVLNTLN